MAHKGYNGRVLALWLGDCMQRAVHKTLSADREFGKWLHDAGRWPSSSDDELLAPTAVAM